MHINIQNLCNKLNEIDIYLTEHRPSVICFTETWTPSRGMDSMLIPGYAATSYFCRKDRIHGGVAIYTKEDISAKPINMSEFSVEMHLECCAVLMNLEKYKLIIITVYRPPAGNIDIFITQLSTLLTHTYATCPKIVLCGDLNIDSMKTDCVKHKILCDLLAPYNLKNHCQEPTRVFTSKTGTSISSIDYMITNIDESLLNCSVVNPNLSDHLLQILTIETAPPRNEKDITKFQTRVTSEASLHTLKLKLKNESWNGIEQDNINEAFSIFLETFLWHFDTACPKKKVIIKNKKTKTWITADITKLKNEIEDLYILTKQNNNYEDLKMLYKQKKKLYKQKINEAKISHNKKSIETSQNKSKAIWKLVNTELGRTKQNPNIHLTVENREYKDEKEVADQFGKYFATVAERKVQAHFDAGVSTTCTTCPLVNYSIFAKPVNKSEVISVIRSLKSKNSSGFDEVSTKVLKAVCEEIADPLVTLINSSLSSGRFPSSLKLASVIPIFKKGDPTDIENYRPVSLLSAFSKIFERILYNRLINFFEHNNLLSPNQHGFRSQRSTETASFHFSEFIHSQLDKNRTVVGLFFDLSRAFDTIDISFVENKLYNLGVRGNVLSWLISFLSDRKLLVKIKHIKSETHDINIGAAQGSVLAPLIFLLYINDLTLPGFMINFADDTSVAISADSEEQLNVLLERVLNDMNAWCFSNKLILNESKTVRVNFFKTKPTANIENNSENVKFLGSFLDAHLTWGPQIDLICTKLNRSYFALLKLRQNVEISTLLSSYYALVYPHLNYNIILWGRAAEVKRVFIIQKRIIRLIFGMKYLDTCRCTFKTNRILTVASIFILKCATFVHNNKNLFQLNSENHAYPTRHSCQLSIPRHKTTMYEKSPYYSCVKIYNKLPDNLKDKSATVFNKDIKRFLCDHSFYSINEFFNL